jgi:hypothetical protein
MLGLLALEKGNRSTMESEGVVETLVQLCARETQIDEDAGIHAPAASALHTLAADSTNMVTRIVDAGAVALLVNICSRSRNCAPIAAAARALGTIAGAGAAVADEVARAGAIPPLVEACGAGGVLRAVSPIAFEAAVAAANVLAVLATYPTRRDQLVDAGVVPALLHLCGPISQDHMQLLEQAVCAFANLCEFDLQPDGVSHSGAADASSARRQLMMSRGAGRIVGKLCASIADPVILNHSARAMSLLCEDENSRLQVCRVFSCNRHVFNHLFFLLQMLYDGAVPSLLRLIEPPEATVYSNFGQLNSHAAVSLTASAAVAKLCLYGKGAPQLLQSGVHSTVARCCMHYASEISKGAEAISAKSAAAAEVAQQMQFLQLQVLSSCADVVSNFCISAAVSDCDGDQPQLPKLFCQALVQADVGGAFMLLCGNVVALLSQHSTVSEHSKLCRCILRKVMSIFTVLAYDVAEIGDNSPKFRAGGQQFQSEFHRLVSVIIDVCSAVAGIDEQALLHGVVALKLLSAQQSSTKQKGASHIASNHVRVSETPGALVFLTTLCSRPVASPVVLEATNTIANLAKDADSRRVMLESAAVALGLARLIGHFSAAEEGAGALSAALLGLVRLSADVPCAHKLHGQAPEVSSLLYFR